MDICDDGEQAPRDKEELALYLYSRISRMMDRCGVIITTVLCRLGFERVRFSALLRCVQLLQELNTRDI